MFIKVKSKLIWSTLFSFALINSANIQLPDSELGSWLTNSNEAYARSSGGRSGGGSFSRSSSPSRSSPSRSSSSSSSSNSNRGNTGGRVRGGSFDRPSTTTNSPSNPTYPNNQPYGGGTVIVPVPVAPQRSYPYNQYPNTPNSTTTPPQEQTNSNEETMSDGEAFFWVLMFLLFILLVFGIGTFIVYSIVKRLLGSSKGKELDNDTVTVTKLQVALLAEARSIQSQLSELSLNADTETNEGLLYLLQESALALLRSPEYWTHVLASSQTGRKDEIETIFNQLSIEERSKFSAETLTNIDGEVREREPIEVDPGEDPAAYIVVTLLIGTADDKPLFGEIRSIGDLKTALEEVAAISSDYLLVFELLWSPQAETDSLTYDELLTEYTEMVQI